MARAPSAPGKTRLLGAVPESRLRRLRAALVCDALQVVTGLSGISPYVFYTPLDARDEMALFTDTRVPTVPQCEGDLGARMQHALRHLLDVQRYAAAILVGTDIPLMTGEHIAAARDALLGTSVVLGPTDDGGYYLIGMTKVWDGLFNRIRWGSELVLTDTLRAAESLAIDVHLIAGTYDIDTFDDLRRLERDLETMPATIAPNVRRWFADQKTGGPAE